MISLTSFKNIWDNKTNARLDFKEWNHFEKFLYGIAQRPLQGKRDAELISPAVYIEGTTRANRNVIGWAGWAAVDVDDHEFKGDLQEELFKRLGEWYYVVYSTASSTVEKPKFRIVFRLDEDVPVDKIRHFWFSLQTAMEDNGDKQCKDFSRMYYVPSDYNKANNFIFTNHGTSLVVRDLLNKYPYVERKNGNSFMDRLPEELQQQVIQHRKDQQTNTQFKWASYHDCPFWPQNLGREYGFITGTGWYHKMYQIMVATASRAVEKGYPITANEIGILCKGFDSENGNWYENRPLNVEADRAIEFVYKNG